MWLTVFGILLLSVFLLFSYWNLKQKINEKQQQIDFDRIFGDWKESKPTLEFGAEYGRASFYVSFKSKSDLDFAIRNKLTEDFKNCISKYYDKNFSVDAAVKFSYLNGN
jgi:hypothetical protein